MGFASNLNVIAGATTSVGVVAMSMNSGKIVGQITHAGQFIAGAFVSVNRQGWDLGSDMTKEDGSFSVLMLPDGQFHLMAVADGYWPNTNAIISIMSGATVTQNVELVQ